MFGGKKGSHVVIEKLYFHSLLGLATQHLHKGLACSIIMDNKGFHADALGGILHVLQHILEQVLSPAINFAGGSDGQNTLVSHQVHLDEGLVFL